MIGFYGGTFNPIHFGHLNLALEIMEREGLDEVWFCPTQRNPLRLDDSLVAAEHRLKMVELAISEIPQFSLLDMECRRQGPSYTIDTLRELTALHHEHFRLILGSDSLVTFHRWRSPEEIIRLAHPLVGQRSAQVPEAQGRTDIVAALQEGWVPIPVMEISASAIRERLRQKRYCGHLVPAKVLDYIRLHHLYY